jgi:hypothetical protein
MALAGATRTSVPYRDSEITGGDYDLSLWGRAGVRESWKQLC